MKTSVLTAALLLALGSLAPLRAQLAMPLVRDVDPASVTYGDVVTVTGENLDQETVAALYLTDGKNDIKVVITEQTAASIKFKIPFGIEKGRFAVMVLTRGKDAKFIEEPVKVLVEPPGTVPTS